MMWELRGNCESLLCVEGKLQNIKTGGFYVGLQEWENLENYCILFIHIHGKITKLQNVDQ